MTQLERSAMAFTEYGLVCRLRASLRHCVPGLQFVEATSDEANVVQRLYESTARRWGWQSRLDWSEEAWRAHLGADHVLTGLAVYQHEAAGFFELNAIASGVPRIKYMAVVDALTGRGMGRAMLDHVLDVALRHGAEKLYVETRSCDHPRALRNYLASGFTIVSERYVGATMDRS